MSGMMTGMTLIKFLCPLRQKYAGNVKKDIRGLLPQKQEGVTRQDALTAQDVMLLKENQLLSKYDILNTERYINAFFDKYEKSMI